MYCVTRKERWNKSINLKSRTVVQKCAMVPIKIVWIIG